MKRLLAMVVILILFVPMFLFLMPLVKAGAPVISSVSPVTATNLQVIRIDGSGFGNTWPQTVPAWDGDGSVDTVVSSTTPCMGFGNNGVPPDAWAAGVQNASNGVHCAIGIYLTSWSDTEIVLGGFGSALQTNGQGSWNIAPGDPLDVAVFTQSGEAHYKTTVTRASPPGTPPVITSVSTIAAANLQNIYIYGSGFGNTWPQTISLGDGSVDTIVTGTTPVLCIANNGIAPDAWAAGVWNDSVVFCAIGLRLVSWSDTEIVLGGFGSALNTNGQGPWNIATGDPLDVAVFTQSGEAHYKTTVTPSTYGVFFEESGLGNPAQVWSVTLDGYGTEYSNGPGNTIYTIIFNGVANGGPYQFTVTPPSGFVAQPTANPITVNGGDVHQPITFSTVPATCTFTLSANSGGTVSYSFSLGSGTVLSGQSQQLTVPQGCQFTLTGNPDSLHVFQTWSTTGSASVSNSSSASTKATVNGNGDVTANFAYNLVVSISPTSTSIQSGQPATFTATPSGGSGGYKYVWHWMEYGANPPNHGSQNTDASGMYIFTPSSAGDYGVYVIVTDSGGKAAQSLSSSITAVDFQLEVTPKSQTVPCGEDGSFLIKIVPINGLVMNSEVQLSRSSLPPGVFGDFDSSTIEPSETSCLTVTVLQPQTSTISFTITASTTITIGGTNVNLVHTQTVTVNTKDVMGMKSVVTLNTVNVVPNAVALTLIGGWTGLIPGPYYGSVPTSEAFTIQQNFYVDVPAWSSGTYTPYRYWVQNTIICENFAIYGWYAIGVAEIYNATPGYVPGPIPTPEAKSYTLLPIDNPTTGQSLSLPGIYTLVSQISGGQVILSNGFFSYSWTIPTGNGRSPQDSYINPGSREVQRSPPELVIVGAGWGSTVGFLSSTSGSVQSYIQLEGQSWASSLDESVVGFGSAATKELSQGLNWQIGASNAASFSVQSSSTDQQGVFCRPVATSTTQDGATFENQITLTGVSVSISGSSAQDGTPVTITAAQIVRPTYPPGTVEIGLNPAAYYDVNVQGISDGTARVCITNSGVAGQTTIQYWNGAQWVGASDVSVSGNTICGNIPVSALTGTIIAIGPILPRDVGVVEVTPYRNWAYQGRPINISVTTTNFGAFTENETLNLFYTGVGGAGMIGSAIVVLAPNQTEILVFSWNTSGVPLCYSGYNITAFADISPEIDSNMTNNVLQSPLTVEIRILGDINGDGKVDGKDIALVALSFGSCGPDFLYPGSPAYPRWNLDCDINGDNRIDGKDLTLAALNFGIHG